MSIVIENQALEDELAKLAVQQTVPTRKRQLAETILRKAIDRCVATDDPEAWARDLERDSVRSKQGSALTSAIADAMIEGRACSHCELLFLDPDKQNTIYKHGYPVLCRGCWHNGSREERAEIRCAKVETMRLAHDDAGVREASA